MVAGLAILPKEFIQKPQFNVLILGGGAGILANFLLHFFKNFNIESVEISKPIIDVFFN